MFNIYTSNSYYLLTLALSVVKIQIFQNKILRIITDAPWFMVNENLHKDLQILKTQDHV